MYKENWWVNDYRVRVFLKGKEVYAKVVRSKASRTAITNVLTNHYRGDMDNIKVEQLTTYQPLEGKPKQVVTNYETKVVQYSNSEEMKRDIAKMEEEGWECPTPSYGRLRARFRKEVG